MSTSATLEQEEQLVAFRLAGETYGIPIMLVHEIIRPCEITRIPRSPEYVRGVVNDPRIHIEKIDRGAHDPPPLAPMNDDYRKIETAIGRAFPRAVISPALVLGATDGRHYQSLANGVYRFAPFIFRPEDLPRLHGIDERVKIGELIFAVRGYMELINQAVKSN